MFKKFYPYEYVESVCSIDYAKLVELGYEAVIFDIDNTLVHHGTDSTPEIDALFREIHNAGLKTLLLSNNNVERIERFLKNIDSLYIPYADKPKPAKYYKALEMLGVTKDKTVMIGDQVFTDVYGANRCKMPSVLVKFLRRPGETKLGKKRMVEKIVLYFYSKSRRYQHRIGDICKERSGLSEAEKAVL